MLAADPPHDCFEQVTKRVEVSCPDLDLDYGWSCAALHYGDSTYWQPILEYTIDTLYRLTAEQVRMLR